MSARREPLLPLAVATVGIVLAVLDAIAAGAARSGGWSAYFAVVAAVALVVGAAGLAHTETVRRLRPARSATASQWRSAESPVRARKAAWLRFDARGVSFDSLQGRGSYAILAAATCTGAALSVPVRLPLTRKRLVRLLQKLLAEFPHEAPLERCTCGFYGSVGHVEVPTAGEVLLDVELSGRVLRHGDVRRGELQRVLSVAIPRRCGASRLITDGGLHGPDGTEPARCGATAVGLRLAGGRLMAVCETHSGGTLLSPVEVERQAGVPVGWHDDGVIMAR